MNKKEITFDPYKVAAYRKLSSRYFNQVELEVGLMEDDFVRNLLTVQLSGYIYKEKVSEKKLVYYCPKPKFLDWFLGRERMVEWTVEVSDVLKDPPAMPNRTDRIIIATMTDDQVKKPTQH